MSENIEHTAPDTTYKTGTKRKKKPQTLEELQAAKEELTAAIDAKKKERVSLARKIAAKRRIINKQAKAAEAAERKRARTHRLCVIGGIIESAAACEISNFDTFKDWAFRFGYKIRGTQGLPELSPQPEERAEFDAVQAEIDAI